MCRKLRRVVAGKPGDERVEVIDEDQGGRGVGTMPARATGATEATQTTRPTCEAFDRVPRVFAVGSDSHARGVVVPRRVLHHAQHRAPPAAWPTDHQQVAVASRREPPRPLPLHRWLVEEAKREGATGIRAGLVRQLRGVESGRQRRQPWTPRVGAAGPAPACSVAVAGVGADDARGHRRIVVRPPHKRGPGLCRRKGRGTGSTDDRAAVSLVNDSQAHPQWDVREQRVAHGAGRALRAKYQVDPECAPARRNVNEEVMQCGMLRQKRGELIDDDEQSRHLDATVGDVAGTRVGKARLPPANLRTQALERPARARRVKVSDHPDHVRQLGKRRKRRATLEISEEQHNPLWRVERAQGADPAHEQFTLPAPGHARHQRVGAFADDIEREHLARRHHEGRWQGTARSQRRGVRPRPIVACKHLAEWRHDFLLRRAREHRRRTFAKCGRDRARLHLPDQLRRHSVGLVPDKRQHRRTVRTAQLDECATPRVDRGRRRSVHDPNDGLADIATPRVVSIPPPRGRAFLARIHHPKLQRRGVGATDRSELALEVREFSRPFPTVRRKRRKVQGAGRMGHAQLQHQRPRGGPGEWLLPRDHHAVQDSDSDRRIAQGRCPRAQPEQHRRRLPQLGIVGHRHAARARPVAAGNHQRRLVTRHRPPQPRRRRNELHDIGMLHPELPPFAFMLRRNARARTLQLSLVHRDGGPVRSPGTPCRIDHRRNRDQRTKQREQEREHRSRDAPQDQTTGHRNRSGEPWKWRASRLAGCRGECDQAVAHASITCRAGTQKCRPHKYPLNAYVSA